MEETLSHARFISFHRNQINPEPHPLSTLTFAYGDQKYGKYIQKQLTYSPPPHCRQDVQRNGNIR